MASLNDLVVNVTATYNLQPAKCAHGIERGRCLDIACIGNAGVPIRGQKSWDEVLNPPQPVDPYTIQFPVNLFTHYYATTTPPKPREFVQLPLEKREMPVVGFRAWNWGGEYRLGRGVCFHLRSTGVGQVWEPGTNEAIHHGAAALHEAPQSNCDCGLYVLADLDTVATHAAAGGSRIFGAVMGWGRVIQHGVEGWRAQKASILALLDAKYSKKQTKHTEAAAEMYGVPVLERDGLERMVREYGDPLPNGAAS